MSMSMSIFLSHYAYDATEENIKKQKKHLTLKLHHNNNIFFKLSDCGICGVDSHNISNDVQSVWEISILSGWQKLYLLLSDAANSQSDFDSFSLSHLSFHSPAG